MELLKLVIVDDEPILLQGLLDTYDWESMGFEVVGSAKSGVQALEVIRREQPHVVLTDIRMKQMTGLMVMEEIQKEQISCLFVVLSAYRDFEYAKHACDLGAYAYLLKPIDDEQLRSTMTGAYNTCIKQLRSEEKYESWEQLLLKDGDSFLQVVIQKYVQNLIPEELSPARVSQVYANEADVLNVAMFGMTAFEWREAHPDLKGNIRDYATINELICLSNMENLNAVFIQEGMDQQERLLKLNRIAIQQMRVLADMDGRKLMK